MDHSSVNELGEMVRAPGQRVDHDGSEDTRGCVESLRVLVEKEGKSIINHMTLCGYWVETCSVHPDMVGPLWFLEKISWTEPQSYTGDLHVSVAVFYTPTQGWGLWEHSHLHCLMDAEEVLEKAKMTLVAYEKGESPWK